MKFLIDAQLPRAAVEWLTDHGHDAIHSSSLAAGNCTTDNEIVLIAEADGRVVVTKDSDFLDSQKATGRPSRLLIIKTGNINNLKLKIVLSEFLSEAIKRLQEDGCVVLHADGIRQLI